MSGPARAGLIVLLTLLIFYLKGLLEVALFGPHYGVPRHILMALLSTGLLVPMVIVARRYLDRRPVAGLGLALDRQALRPFLVGALAWALPFAVTLSICLANGWIAITPLRPWSEILGFLPLLIALVFLLEALPEELVFRGYVFTNMATAMSRGWAVAVQAMLFALWGTALWTVETGSLPLDRTALFLVMGILTGMLRVVTGSVWASIGFHLVFQTTAQLLLSVERGHFAIDNVGLLQNLALGAIPFALAIPIAEWLFPGERHWNARRTDA